jgi:hypothetical protein
MMKIQLVIGLFLAACLSASMTEEDRFPDPESRQSLPAELEPFFRPPEQFRGDLGQFTSPLRFYDGRPVQTRAEWSERRREILSKWHEFLGAWPPLIKNPKIENRKQESRDSFVQQSIVLEVGPESRTTDGYLLIPEGDGPFPAVVVVYYDPETGIGLGRELRDFGYQLAKRGFVALSIGTPETMRYYPSKENAILQPLSALAYVAANCWYALAGLPEVDEDRIGIVGHSYGGKWAMFASCLFERFACGVWSDGGIVFDETRPNVNFWEPWYLGYEVGKWRREGVPTAENPRTGAYRELVAQGHDLHELHALMAPRPFLVSGGSEDSPQRWIALNHAVAVNDFLGVSNRVAMTNREKHAPTQESNEQIYRFFEFFLASSSRSK